MVSSLPPDLSALHPCPEGSSVLLFPQRLKGGEGRKILLHNSCCQPPKNAPGGGFLRSLTLLKSFWWAFSEVRVEAPAAAAAKSLQTCPTLCDPIDGSPPSSTVPGILQARTLEWVAISFSTALPHLSYERDLLKAFGEFGGFQAWATPCRSLSLFQSHTFWYC